MGHHLLINPQYITRIFVASDVSTFLVQVRIRTHYISPSHMVYHQMTGGSFTVTGTATNDSKKLHLGAQVCTPHLLFLAHPSPIQIFLAGLALQLLSFFIFTLIFIRFLIRVRTHAPHVWSPSPSLVWWRDWRTLAAAMSLSCVGILVRPPSPPLSSHHLISLSPDRSVRHTAQSSSPKASKAHSPSPKSVSTVSTHSRSSSPSPCMFPFGQHNFLTRRRRSCI